mmetsp:Transcript_28989/g.59421  ORF Transcript_28989/g.59421 Transcript_28989/m.59421 type:complete len:166 (-) Transcript_28989:255-752(-)
MESDKPTEQPTEGAEPLQPIRQDSIRSNASRSRSAHLAHTASTGSLFNQNQTFAQIERGDEPEPPPSFFNVLRKNAYIIGFIALLLIITFLCSYFEALRLPVCALQTFAIALVSVRWEEGSWLATGPRRAGRLCCQVFLLLVPLIIGVLLIFILVTQQSEEVVDE